VVRWAYSSVAVAQPTFLVRLARAHRRKGARPARGAFARRRSPRGLSAIR